MMPAVRVISDDDLLWALEARCTGWGAADIGAQIGVTAPYVRVITNRVLAADLAESGEDSEIVKAAYWGAS